MKKSQQLSIALFTLLASWFCVGLLVQSFSGGFKVDEHDPGVYKYMAMAILFVTIVPALAFYGVYCAARKKFFSKLGEEPKIRPTRVFLSLTGSLILAAAVHGGLEGHQRGVEIAESEKIRIVQEKKNEDARKAREAAAREKAEAEERRIAAMTPAERAAEEAEKKRKIELAAAEQARALALKQMELKKAQEVAAKREELRLIALKKENKKAGVRIGMTKQDVYESSWGRPNSVNKTTNRYGVHEQWVYEGRNYLYFENGILTSVQN
jgi:hypothetical protein